MRSNPYRWLKSLFRSHREPRLDPLDNSFRRMRFGQNASGGLNGTLGRRLGNYENPTPLDQEEL
ncbi:unannotated protein [freshwater metagenome]|uniref:Unannotated protein n=1 Tax=freshwater metagenome TaxID=449393 RepID=A0A6J6ZIN6_9ZZZZ